MAAQRLSAAARRAQIATVAASLFAKKGFAGVTTREIARKARVNEAILYRHFPTKEALYTEIINQKIDVKPETFDCAEVHSGDDRQVFRFVARYFLNEAEKDRTFLRLMLYSALEDHALASVFLKERTGVLFDFILTYIERRMRAGAFRKKPPAVVLGAFMGMFFHFILAHELFKIPAHFRVSKEEAIEQYVDIFLHGMCIS